MSADKVRDALAALARPGCSCDHHGSNGIVQQCREWRTREGYRIADAIIGSDVLATIKADAWDEGNEAAIRGFRSPGLDPELNPYRAEGSA